MTDRERTPAKVESSFVEAATSVEGMLSAWRQYQQLRKRLETEGDFIAFRDSKGRTQYAPTKQWRTKLERFFGLSVEIVERQIIEQPGGEFLFVVKARVSHPKGAYHEATGACSTLEKKRDGDRRFHNALAHAETRAKNRAVLEFVGFGEVSAEEIESESPYSLRENGKDGNGDSSKITPNQRRLLYELMCKEGGLGWTEEEAKRWLYEKFGVSSTVELTREQASRAIREIQEMIKAKDRGELSELPFSHES